MLLKVVAALEAKAALDGSAGAIPKDDTMHQYVAAELMRLDPSLADDLSEISDLRLAADIDVTSTPDIGAIVAASSVAEGLGKDVIRLLR